MLAVGSMSFCTESNQLIHPIGSVVAIRELDRNVAQVPMLLTSASELVSAGDDLLLLPLLPILRLRLPSCLLFESHIHSSSSFSMHLKRPHHLNPFGAGLMHPRFAQRLTSHPPD